MSKRPIARAQRHKSTEFKRRPILEKLEEQNLEVNEEKIEYSVSKVTQDSEDAFENRVFKIDSNLPSYDGDGEAPYEELADLISRVFDGQLELLHVDIDFASDPGSSSSPESSRIPRRNP